jgi:hypothetical protein
VRGGARLGYQCVPQSSRLTLWLRYRDLKQNAGCADPGTRIEEQTPALTGPAREAAVTGAPDLFPQAEAENLVARSRYFAAARAA